MNAYEFGDNYTIVPLGDNRFVIGVNMDHNNSSQADIYAMAASFGKRMNALVFIIMYRGEFKVHDLDQSSALKDYVRSEVLNTLKEATS